MVRLTPVFYIAFWFSCGILFSSCFPVDWMVAGSVTMVFIALAFLFRSSLRKFPVILYSIFLVWGLFWPAEILRQKDRLDAALAAGSNAATLRCTVLSEPSRTSSGFTFLFVRIDELDGRPTDIRASCSAAALPEVRTGWVIEGIGILERNDSRTSLSRGSYGDLDLKFVEKIIPRRTFATALADARLFIDRTVTRGLPPDLGAVMSGLMLGISPAMPIRIQAAFSNSGTMHILAVSGLHLGIIAFVVFFLIRLVVPQRTWGLLILSAVVVIYTMLIGERASILRAALMTEIGVLVWLLDRDHNYWNVIGLSALILLAYNPFFLFNIGFQLSYAAVIGMIAFNPFFLKLFGFLPKWLRENTAVSFSAQLPVTPFVLVYFHKVVLISVLANLLAVPLSSVNIIAGFISVFFGAIRLDAVADLINLVNGFLLRILLAWSEWFSKAFYFKMEDPGILLPVGLGLGVVALFIAVNFSGKTWSKRAVWLVLAVAVVLSGCAFAVPRPAAKAIILSAGNASDLIVVRLRDRDLIFFDADVGKVERTLRSFMMVRSIRTFDRVFLMSGRARTLEGFCALATNRDPRWPAVRSVYGPASVRAVPAGMEWIPFRTPGVLWQTNGVSVRMTSGGLFVLTSGSNTLVIEPASAEGFDAPEATVLYRGKGSSWYDDAKDLWPDPLMRTADPGTVIIKKNKSKGQPVWKGRVVNLLKNREVSVSFFPGKTVVKTSSW
jgi:ComEC/Rec2-related protein